MPYFFSHGYDSDPNERKYGYSLPVGIQFSQIFDGAPQFYTGSVINVQEILEIETSIIPAQARLVDVDLRWFQPKRYIGTYQFEAGLTSILNEQELGQGFLTNELHTFIRRSTYTIVADPDVPIAAEQVFTVSNCNFETVEASASVGGATISIQKPLRNDNMFQGRMSQSRAPLTDGNYNQFFRTIGLYINPGCIPVALRHRIAVINTLQTNFIPYPEFTCELLGG